MFQCFNTVFGRHTQYIYIIELYICSFFAQTSTLMDIANSLSRWKCWKCWKRWHCWHCWKCWRWKCWHCCCCFRYLHWFLLDGNRDKIGLAILLHCHKKRLGLLKRHRCMHIYLYLTCMYITNAQKMDPKVI